MKEGIYLEKLTSDEEFIEFQRMYSYEVPAGMKHQIVHDEDDNDIGVAISRNGRGDFRQFSSPIFYWFTGPFAYVVGGPKKNNVRLE